MGPVKAAILDRPILPSRLRGLRDVTWNRDPDRPIPAREAFAFYEAYWRFVDQGALSPEERELITALTERFGHGVMLA